MIMLYHRHSRTTLKTMYGVCRLFADMSFGMLCIDVIDVSPGIAFFFYAHFPDHLS